MPQQNRAKEVYEHYRNTGVAFSVTLISLSSALILWTHTLYTGDSPPDSTQGLMTLIAQGLLFCVTILSCLCIQFFNYKGYMCEARSYYRQSSQGAADAWFIREDVRRQLFFRVSDN